MISIVLSWRDMSEIDVFFLFALASLRVKKEIAICTILKRTPSNVDFACVFVCESKVIILLPHKFEIFVLSLTTPKSLKYSKFSGGPRLDLCGCITDCLMTLSEKNLSLVSRLLSNSVSRVLQRLVAVSGTVF